MTWTPPPTLTASFTWTPLSPDVGNTVTFTATISGRVTPYNMTWNSGDGTRGIGLSPTHTFTAKGVYYVTTNAADNIGEQATIKMQVTIGPWFLSFSMIFFCIFFWSLGRPYRH